MNTTQRIKADDSPDREESEGSGDAGGKEGLDETTGPVVDATGEFSDSLAAVLPEGIEDFGEFMASDDGRVLEAELAAKMDEAGLDRIMSEALDSEELDKLMSGPTLDELLKEKGVQGGVQELISKDKLTDDLRNVLGDPNIFQTHEGEGFNPDELAYAFKMAKAEEGPTSEEAELPATPDQGSQESAIKSMIAKLAPSVEGLRAHAPEVAGLTLAILALVPFEALAGMQEHLDGGWDGTGGGTGDTGGGGAMPDFEPAEPTEPAEPVTPAGGGGGGVKGGGGGMPMKSVLLKSAAFAGTATAAELVADKAVKDDSKLKIPFTGIAVLKGKNAERAIVAAIFMAMTLTTVLGVDASLVAAGGLGVVAPYAMYEARKHYEGMDGSELSNLPDWKKAIVMNKAKTAPSKGKLGTILLAARFLTYLIYFGGRSHGKW